MNCMSMYLYITSTYYKYILYPIQKVTEIYKKVTEPYNFVTELENSSWNVLSLLRSEVAYIGTGHILP
jgi:hypothetical protein